ncbi:hypothetical protein LJR098_003116 [Rhizobium sp. LjRoot98]|uniref:hypothetical protein n=1 Tax=unclassified Rhizobium TaxID=2613769 RepID=UPI000726E017|nr:MULTISPECIES: hypothetical protein [unclassified Rhizobium]KQY10579.1 hypothetical protein ASD36_07490 [Rhizobium sp. Root1334]KRC04577.1 hypothetical protein ASE23_05255 [Rhizobium sp. Root73]
MIDENFFYPRKPVAIVALGDSAEALLLRAILESLGAAVSLHLPGTPGDALKCLQREEKDAEYVILSGHGDENGFVLGEFVDDIDAGMLIDGSLPADALAGAIRLPAKTVISTACATGTDAFGQAFIAAGARAYAAPSDFPDGSAVPLFLHGLFYELLHGGKTLEEAIAKAQAFDTGNELSFVLFKAQAG